MHRHVTIAIDLASIAERYGAEFAEIVRRRADGDGDCGFVWMTAGDYADLLVGWATDGEGPINARRID